MANSIGEWVTIINCDPFFAHSAISISNDNWRCGKRAASGSSKR